MYMSANGEPIYGSPYTNQNPYMSTSPGYNNGFMNPPEPPTLGGNGYNIGQPSTPGYHNINDPYGYGWNQGYSQQYQGNYGYSPYYQQQPYFTGQSIYANPGNYGWNQGYNPYNQFYQQPQYQDRIINVPGFSLSNNPMITDQDIKKVQQLYEDMCDEIDEKQDQNVYNSPYVYNNYYGYNPYGWGGWSTYQIQQKYDQQVREILNEAEQRRIDWNKRLLRMCHHYMNDDVTDEESDRSLDGYQIRIPGAKVQEDHLYDYLCTARPVNEYDNPYARHWMELEYEYNQLAPNTDNMNEFFRDLGKVRMYEEFINENSRRRNPNRFYDSTGYRELIRKSKKERDASNVNLNDDKNQTLVDLMSQPKGTVNKEQIEHSILNDMGISKYAHFENGSLTLNDPPDWVGKRPIVDEEMENVHIKDKDAFLKSIYQKDGGG